jgi:hypothetical protein
MSPLSKLCVASVMFLGATFTANAAPFATHVTNQHAIARNASNGPSLFDRRPSMGKALRAPCIMGPKHFPCR